MPTSIQASYPGSNSSYFLNNYELGGSDIGLCLISGLTCIPYAERHWALSKVNSDYSSWHKVIAILEYLPLIGGPVALVERVIAFASSFFSLRQDPHPLKPSQQHKRPTSQVMRAPQNLFHA